ncbi:hypothetical protein C9F11_10195 [Streptomyces sp. YIM 121038]|uniref:hypothetical protein n=1 Tax=Streptomyces sp. YIM 121038 TaxID=2136401 RepID=UPI0011107036|nr:hypothetical protein [Streptomyces sp. YIM 121038]QCX75719.1 hypothetical protein C9F11_10195 [Streptomyces sp. YIM 121038]
MLSVERYEVSGEQWNEKWGHHFEVRRVNSRGTQTVVHRYKGQARADRVCEALNELKDGELL